MKFYIGSGFKNCELVNYYSKILEENGWKHTYNWAKNINNYETIEDLIEYSKLEQKGIKDSDVVIILLPAGRGTHIELGMALALNRKIFLCSTTKDEFNIENTVNFYQLPNIIKLVGTADENLKEIIKMSQKIENIIIRNVEEKDIPSVVDIQINGWKTAYRGIIDDNTLDSMNRNEKIEKRRKDYKNNGFIVAELNNEVVGFCRYIDSNKFTQDITDIDCELLALYVKSDLKYNGIGTKLFQYVVNEFKCKDKTRMILWCLKDNEPSKKFYTKMGGEIIKEKIIKIGEQNYYEVGFRYNI